MHTSAAGIALIKGFESFKAKPYLCPANVPTIGYGSTYYEDGTKVRLTDQAISEQRASSLLAYQLAGEYEPGVATRVTVDLRQCELDALVSFAYNCGIGNFAKSTLLKKLNAGDKAGAAAEFVKWVRGGGKVLPGLVRRRAAERALFEGRSDAGA